jgi:hypothetical protein
MLGTLSSSRNTNRRRGVAPSNAIDVGRLAGEILVRHGYRDELDLDDARIGIRVDERRRREVAIVAAIAARGEDHERYGTGTAHRPDRARISRHRPARPGLPGVT